MGDRSQAGIYKFDKDRVEQGEGRMGHIGTKSFAGAADGDEPRSIQPRTAPVEFERDDGESRERGRGSGQGRRDRSRSRRGSGRLGGDAFGLDGLLEDARKKR